MMSRKLVRTGGVVMDSLLRSPPGCTVWDPRAARVGRCMLAGNAVFAWKGLVCESSRGIFAASSRLGLVTSRLGRMEGGWKTGEGRKSYCKLEAGEGSLATEGSGGDGGGGGGGRYTGRGGGGGGGGDSFGDGEQPERSSTGLRAMSAWYMTKLYEHPVATKAVTAGILNIFGDFISQVLVEHKAGIDLSRSAIFFLIGVVLVGPSLHYWYLSLSKLVTVGGPTGAALRLVVDQLAFAPAFIAVFFGMLLTLEGRPSDIGPKLQQDWASTVLTNWKIWVPFQFLNFLFVPQQLQVAAANVIALGWNVYLSFSSHKEVEPATPGAPAT